MYTPKRSGVYVSVEPTQVQETWLKDEDAEVPQVRERTIPKNWIQSRWRRSWKITQIWSSFSEPTLRLWKTQGQAQAGKHTHICNSWRIWTRWQVNVSKLWCLETFLLWTSKMPRLSLAVTEGGGEVLVRPPNGCLCWYMASMHVNKNNQKQNQIHSSKYKMYIPKNNIQ